MCFLEIMTLLLEILTHLLKMLTLFLKIMTGSLNMKQNILSLGNAAIYDSIIILGENWTTF